MAVLLPWAASFAADPSQPLVQRLGLVPVFGVYACTFAVNASHELVHRRTRLERLGGGLLAAMICYGTFAVEHVRGHHVHVATPEDPSSAPRGISVWRFLPRAVWGNVCKAFTLEAARLRKQGRRTWTLRNGAVAWTAVSVGLAVGLAALSGVAGLAFFLGQSLVAASSLEINNYVEHYGLRRRRTAKGRYEPVGRQHCWCGAEAGSDAVLLSLPRHADHHMRPGRTFAQLRHFGDSPRLPASYAAMYFIAMVPPLWFATVHPILDAHRGAVQADAA
jgi:alkane 1-monooxygenase